MSISLFMFFIVMWFFVWKKTSKEQYEVIYEENKDNDQTSSILESLLKKEDLNEILGISFNQLQPEDNCKILTVRRTRFDKINNEEAYVIEIYVYNKLHQPNIMLFEHYYTKDISFMVGEIKRVADKYDICLFNQYS